SGSRLDTAYWGFLGVGTTLDIFQNIILIPYLEYDVLSPLDTIGNGGDSFWKVDDDFDVDVLRFQTCLTDILGFLEKLGWWFEQDIDDEEDKDCGEV
ncbi:hypothetical protein Tco_0468061, partial [Tanacetum coccineum]